MSNTLGSFFLPLTRLYPASFADCFGHIARYTPSTLNKTVSDKLRLFGKDNL